MLSSQLLYLQILYKYIPICILICIKNNNETIISSKTDNAFSHFLPLIFALQPVTCLDCIGNDCKCIRQCTSGFNVTHHTHITCGACYGPWQIFLIYRKPLYLYGILFKKSLILFQVRSVMTSKVSSVFSYVHFC